jgi:proline iminopeptidase
MHLSVNGARLFFDVDGPGLVPDGQTMRERPTLLLLHGGPGFDHSNYKPAFAALTDVAQVIYLDHRGQGRSERSDPSRWTLAQWADDVRAFCDALGIVKPVVMGNSFGGMVAMAYATRHPDHPGKIVLSSTAARQMLPRVLARFEALGGARVAEIARRYWENPGEANLGAYITDVFPVYSRKTGDPNMVPRTRFAFDVMFHFAGGEQRTMNLLPDLARIRCPTLVLAGDDDPICPLEDQEDIVAALPKELVRYEHFAGCGHGVFRDDPARTFRLLREFIRG